MHSVGPSRRVKTTRSVKMYRTRAWNLMSSESIRTECFRCHTTGIPPHGGRCIGVPSCSVALPTLSFGFKPIQSVRRPAGPARHESALVGRTAKPPQQPSPPTLIAAMIEHTELAAVDTA